MLQRPGLGIYSDDVTEACLSLTFEETCSVVLSADEMCVPMDSASLCDLLMPVVVLVYFMQTRLRHR